VEPGKAAPELPGPAKDVAAPIAVVGPGKAAPELPGPAKDVAAPISVVEQGKAAPELAGPAKDVAAAIAVVGPGKAAPELPGPAKDVAAPTAPVEPGKAAPELPGPAKNVAAPIAVVEPGKAAPELPGPAKDVAAPVAVVEHDKAAPELPGPANDPSPPGPKVDPGHVANEPSGPEKEAAAAAKVDPDPGPAAPHPGKNVATAAPDGGAEADSHVGQAGHEAPQVQKTTVPSEVHPLPSAADTISIHVPDLWQSGETAGPELFVPPEKPALPDVHLTDPTGSGSVLKPVPVSLGDSGGSLDVGALDPGGKHGTASATDGGANDGVSDMGLVPVSVTAMVPVGPAPHAGSVKGAPEPAQSTPIEVVTIGDASDRALLFRSQEGEGNWSLAKVAADGQLAVTATGLSTETATQLRADPDVGQDLLRAPVHMPSMPDIALSPATLDWLY
jgi:hypothetical protein